ncbi:MAG: helix-turn-helix domain-containing protein, partial [Patescibacteria group bacterium]
MHPISDSLSQLGLSGQESAVYLAALELGFSSISDIAKKAGIKRPTTYYIVDELIKKNLVSRAPKGKR